MQKVRCSVIVNSRPRGRGYTVIHLIQPVRSADGSDGCEGLDRPPAHSYSSASDPGATSTKPAQVLTEREVDVLRLFPTRANVRLPASAGG